MGRLPLNHVSIHAGKRIDFNWSVIFRVSEIRIFTNLIFFSIFIWGRTWFIFSIFSGRGSLSSLSDRLILSIFLFYFNLCRSFTILEAILLVLSGVILKIPIIFHSQMPKSPYFPIIWFPFPMVSRVSIWFFSLGLTNGFKAVTEDILF